MKAKFLMMPTAIIITVFLSIWVIQPMWFDVKTSGKESVAKLKNEISQERGELALIKTRKANVVKLAGFLQDRQNDVTLINNYYPSERKEEDMLNKINHIAFSTGVYISDLKVKYDAVLANIGDSKDKSGIYAFLAIPKEEIKKDDIASVLKKDNNKNETDSNAISDSKKIEELMKKIKSDKKSFAKSISFDVSVRGNYEQIKRFLAGLRMMGMLDNISSFEIERNVGNQNKKETVADGENSDSQTTLLASNISINFGYLPKKKKNVASLMVLPVFQRGSFDFSGIDENRELLIPKYPDSEVGETGEFNPFFPKEIGDNNGE